MDEITKMKKDLKIILKENQKLQSELKSKNETISSLINQNFVELKALQVKHSATQSDMMKSYERISQDINQKYRLFYASVQKRLKQIVDTHYKIGNEKNLMLTNHNIFLESKIASAEDLRNEQNAILHTNSLKMMELEQNLGSAQLDLVAAHSTIRISKAELEDLSDLNKNLSEDNLKLKNQLREAESSVLERISKVQDEGSREREQCMTQCNLKIKELVEAHEKALSTLKNEYVAASTDADLKINSLTTHVKSFVDSQYMMLNENERLKSENEKMKKGQMVIDQKLKDLEESWKGELASIKSSNQLERDQLLESHNETIKKAHSTADALQNRLNQTIEALTLSRTAISNLKETIYRLEKELQSKAVGESDKCNYLKEENMILREKLERAMDINNKLGSKEKYYESQIAQLQSRCSRFGMK